MFISRFQAAQGRQSWLKSAVVNGPLHKIQEHMSQLTAYALFETLDEVERFSVNSIRGKKIRAEIERRRSAPAISGTDGYWKALKDAWSMINGLRAADSAYDAADRRHTFSYCDTAYENFDGSYAEFEANRGEQLGEAAEWRRKIRKNALNWPLVRSILTAKGPRFVHWLLEGWVELDRNDWNN